MAKGIISYDKQNPFNFIHLVQPISQIRYLNQKDCREKRDLYSN